MTTMLHADACLAARFCVCFFLRTKKKDVNDDGYSDVIISAYGADEAYVFYGAATFLSSVYSLDTLSGADGFIISAGNEGDVLVVAGAGVRERKRERKAGHGGWGGGQQG